MFPTSIIDVSEGLSFIEWELASKLCDKRIPLKNTIGFSSTVLPDLAFINGFRRPTLLDSISCIGIGYAYNYLNNQPKRIFGLFQRFGVASLLVNYYGTSPIGPLIAVGLWHFLSIHLAKDIRAPYKTVEGTGQTAVDRFAVGTDHMFQKGYDPDGLLATLMTSISMWFGRWYSETAVSFNESFIMGLSMMSLGYMFCYTFPHLYPYSQSFWTPSYALGTSGFSLLKMTLIRMACHGLSQYSPANSVIGGLSIAGAHAKKLLIISTLIDEFLGKKLQSFADGWKGKAIAFSFKVAALSTSTLLFHRLFI